ncbi:MAG: glutamate racemase [Cyclobacteriaceae bacterium]|nr:glutamate racemase [Cyclobacteriaceae bacterium]
MKSTPGPIGVFDSGIGGLTVFREIVGRLPEYDFVYLGDNARVPYGTRSYDTVYQYTWECVQHLFSMGSRLVIIACNTASAKALRTIQQRNLVTMESLYRVLGVIRPTTEIVGMHSKTRHVGILATQGTVASMSYVIEINKFFPDIKVFQEACPMWVPLVEANEHTSAGADYFVKKNITSLLQKSPKIDTIILGCTHYPLLVEKIRRFLPDGIKLLVQGPIVAESLADYLHRHPEIDALCTKGGTRTFYTTESTDDFDHKAQRFLGSEVVSRHLQL